MLYQQLDNIMEKIEAISKANDLKFAFKNSNFPILCTFEPNSDNGQIDLFENEEEAEAPKYDQKMEIIFDEEMMIRITEGFVIEDAVLNKLRTNCKKLHYVFLQIYFMNGKQRGA